ncbi:MAG: AraC family transcriptional regulator [Saprospiraceae bacterium]|nr:helix-turn-helix transcriptional regulator [Lewinella sp.]
MEIKIRSNKIEDCIRTIANALESEVLVDCRELKVFIPESKGKGFISGYAFDYGMSLLYLDCYLEEDLDMIFTKDKPHPVHFHFCGKGEFRHELCDGEISYQLNPLNGSISANPADCEQRLGFPPKVNIVHTNVTILRSEYLKKVDCDLENMHDKLETVFRDVDAEQTFLHEINYSVPTSECIRHIAGNGYESLIRSSFAEAKTLELLALQLKQFDDDLDPDTRYVALKRYDLDRILKAKEILVSDLQNAPTIQDLAKLSGINQQKLKRGFKQVFGSTINQYLRDVRMETAKCLIMDGKSTIQDIAERVGYSNQSHFARRFRDKYGMLPKEALQCNAIEVDMQVRAEGRDN